MTDDLVSRSVLLRDTGLDKQMKERKTPELSDSEEYVPLKYVAFQCLNCGRIRVELWSNGWHICEKCNWCVEAQNYVDMTAHNMRVQTDRYSDEIWSFFRHDRQR